MTLPASGQISLNNINYEMAYNQNTINTALSGRSWEAGKTTQPAAMSEFYSYNFGASITAIPIGTLHTVRVLLNNTICAGYSKTVPIVCSVSRMSWTATSSNILVANFGGYVSTSGTGNTNITVTTSANGYPRSCTINITTNSNATWSFTVDQVSTC